MSETFSHIIQDNRINEKQNLSHLTEPVVILDQAWFELTEKLIESTGKKQVINKKLFSFASELSRNMFVKYFEDKEFSYSDKKFTISRYLKDSGLGNVELSTISETGGEIISTTLCKSFDQEIDKDFFSNPYAMGVLCGGLSAAYDLEEEESFTYSKISCKSAGDSFCSFKIERISEENPYCYNSPEWGSFQIADSFTVNNHFDMITETAISLPFYGDHNGEIQCLNNSLVKVFSNYLAFFPFLVCEIAKTDTEGMPVCKRYNRLISDLFIHFFEHLYRSAEWKGLTINSIHKNQDMADSLIAFVNALGYGKLIRKSYKDNTELSILCVNNFESNSQIGSRLIEDKNLSNLFTAGLLRGLMRFIQSKKDQKKLFKLNGIGLKTFKTEQLSSRVKGEDEDIFRVYAR
ncbi:hypothetical protein OO013_06815 [Mangrovivirga sp. M17]|uniref:4-vinyl reductase 4VR domain-containing protein n=1 Tax=Mangrovivirga halotolerans TaxID=2993936 RepID=A0ABT3RPW0_9BACT|nr:hypothetical protein [Mangrovivirga halotolerans]MCX2743568.1 hypothetical protein [Mangrovivirga halotolerans]